MHQLVKAASHALSHHDAQALEHLLEEARTCVSSTDPVDAAELLQATIVLSAQMHAAERHLGLRASKRVAGRSSPWEL